MADGAPAPLAAGLATDILERTVRRFPNRPAIDFLGRRWTYGELGRLVDRAARGFQRLGVAKGSRVGLCLPNTPYSVICAYAVLKAGGTVVNFNPLYAEPEMRAQIADAGCRIMVLLDLPDHCRKVTPLLGRGLDHVVICPLARVLPRLKGLAYALIKGRASVRPRGPGQVAFAELIGGTEPPRPVAVAPADLAVLQYTGGTTGIPKAAMLTHANITLQIGQLMRWMPPTEPGTERMLGQLPLFHVFAMTVVMHHGIAMGAELILLPRFDIEMLMRTIARTRPTCVPGVPTLYTAISNAAEARKADLSSIRICLSGGAPLPAEVKARFERLTGCTLVEGYGLSEASPVVAINPPNSSAKPGSVGLPIADTAVEIHSLDDPSRVLPAGEDGEVWVRGPQVMSGYWNRPDETAKVLVDGMLRTGDVGHLDADGFLFLVDRVKDMIITSGFKVYPRNVEEALFRHPAVAEAAVIGVADEYRGQVPKAFVKLRPGASATEEEIKSFLGHELARYEVPERVEFRDALPMTAVGKVARKDLAAEEAARGRAQSGKAA